MKMLIKNKILLLCCVFVALLFVACQEDEQSSPVITEIRNYGESPNDTLITSLVPGQWVVITGNNLSDAIGIAFNGIPAQFNPALFSDTYAVVQVPAVIPFPSVPEADLNTIKYATTGGETTYDFPILAGPPTLYGIVNENPIAGETVTIVGTNLFLTSELIFAGTTITEFTEVDDGTTLSFVMPEISTSGPVSITTPSGTSSTLFNVNDLTTGVICNFDDIGSMAWGTGTSNNNPDFPGNHGVYSILNNGVLNPGDWSWWNWERSINIEDGANHQWVPVADLNLNVDQFALKFEINIPGEWNGGSIFIVKDYNWTYLARFEPWKISETETVSITTRGKWATVTIPLTEFRTKMDNKDGTGNSAASLTDLVGQSGTGGINFFTINDTSAPTATGLSMAIDNIRVVQIK